MMQRLFVSRPFSALLLSVVTLAFGLPCALTNRVSFASSLPQDGSLHAWLPVTDDDGFVYYDAGDGIRCRPATPDEARAMAQRDPDVPLLILNPEGVVMHQAGGLNIVLRGTAQLDSFPQARAGFLAAAETWKSKITAPITIVIDVDFGPTRFGQPWSDPLTLGSTRTQALGNDQGYTDVRTALVSKATTQQETALANALPTPSVPTDAGSVTGFVGSSALLRALGLIGAVADPATEPQDWGGPPSIGFNSNHSFDFDPSDGIDVDKIDFDAVAVHEIGHALGFVSRVGSHQLSPFPPPSVAVLDLFRFRPGTTMDTFTAAQRLLLPGGEHSFFAGAPELPLSTARADLTGGDGNQASHWKDNAITGQTIGVMDPTMGRGVRLTVTDNDVRAFDIFGYAIPPPDGGNAPSVGSLAGDLRGDSLTLTGSVTDPQGDIAQAQVTLLDSNNVVVRQDAPVPVSFGGATTTTFSLLVTGLNSAPAATKASLVFIDSQGNRSSAAAGDFSQADPGGPDLKTASFNGETMTIKGSGFGGALELEVNGQVVAPPRKIKVKGSGKKLKINGSQSDLNLRAGPNRVRITNGTLRSNLFVLTL
jgi:hypothetical protein